MAEVKEDLHVLPLRMLEESSNSSSTSSPVDAVVFVGISLVLGIASRHLLRGTRVPYTVALLVIGIALGSLEYGTSHKLGKIGDGIRLWKSIDPDLLLAVFLPPLLFESAFAMEAHQIKRCMAQMILLAGPGVLISTFCLGSALKLTFPYEWNWTTSLLLGGLLSATDPVAVVALLKELGASKKLSTIIEGESLMNDGTAIVVYQLFYKMVLGQSFGWGAIIEFLAKVSLGAVGIGIAFGIASVLWHGFIFSDTVIEIALTLAVSYITYFTAQEGVDVSGILAVMTLGMFYAAVAKTAFKGDGQQSLLHFWEMVAYIANTLIFILSGVIIAEGVLGNYRIIENHGYSWGYLILLYVFVQISRCIVVGALYPFLRYFGYGLDLKEATILIWSGLRGAVALSLSLSVKRSSDSSTKISSETGSLFIFFTGGIVFLTLVVNGSTTQFILHFLDMDKLSETKKRVLDYTKYEMLNKALEAFEDLGDDEELGPADWPMVKRYIASLNNLEGDCVHPHTASEADNNLYRSNLKDIRIQLLNGVQSAYWGMLNEGRITRSIANLLIQSVDEAIDVASHEPLCDWQGLKSNVHFPNYYKFTSRFLQKLVTYFTVERLEYACCVCAAFLRAHRIAQRHLHEFIGESDIASTVINESEDEGEEAKKFLEDVRVICPQVLRVIKTRQVTYSVLNHLIDYLQNLEKVGLLEEKEMLHLHDAVQTDLKKLLRNPPLVKIPKITDLKSVHPLLGALPSTVCKPLEGSTKEIMKTRGMTLYKEGSKPNGIWLISNGVVKWTSESISSKHSLHPTFTHGSTLGLYEVLIGKPYICDMITDSAVLCFFIERGRLLSVLRSDPAVKDLLWQESAILLAKILVPQIFEKMTLQDLRALVAQSSLMKTYIEGERVEVRHQSIGFLLEGSIKPFSVQELITPPAALLPSHGNQSFLNADISGATTASFSHQQSRFQFETRGSTMYQAETIERARVIIFYIATLEADRVLQRSSSSFNHSHRTLSRKHEGLMSWPEHFNNARQHMQNHGATDLQANRLSERAIQLSNFGSMVYVPRPSLSHRRVRSYPGYPFFPVRSEGSATLRKNPEARKFTGRVPPAQVKDSDTKEGHVNDDSSDESVAEDEIQIKIDSPSTLSFHQAS
ncbi:sodium/hydrogen exchanger 8-like isoform X2 [Durio zibethinus]|uniref:Sodium/hydrogen exchanger 8-like isoform X2 n=1 Tax=Durio zibethinus TaxID=66656 RepID=A0A6P5Y3E4_DURZI|nr:sodium/hydrogen exchanger 8-like isoform X2 [Durio zibethinus]